MDKHGETRSLAKRLGSLYPNLVLAAVNWATSLIIIILGRALVAEGCATAGRCFGFGDS